MARKKKVSDDAEKIDNAGGEDKNPSPEAVADQKESSYDESELKSHPKFAKFKQGDK